VPLIRLIPGLGALLSDVLHDLVFSLTRNVVAAEDNLEVSPLRVLLDLLADEQPQMLPDHLHELGARGDAVGVEDRVLVDLLSLLASLLDRLDSVILKKQRIRPGA
jgi:hypothetical protein